ncbi:unnamed protein product [Sphenostylis stenocarpa]|uniref:Uncharacterized protein n=1 Tax=Sphenostylis stenocarpa TaxID=92480 RepID=A0AA86SGG8_9FABA|nr:unnamed protein product [Sphenostylis stenocarpa]
MARDFTLPFVTCRSPLEGKDLDICCNRTNSQVIRVLIGACVGRRLCLFILCEGCREMGTSTDLFRGSYCGFRATVVKHFTLETA